MRVLLAMSGGVDSAAAALCLLRAGHEVEGCTLSLTEGQEAELARARDTAAACGIPHRTLDLGAEFYRDVITPFAEEYARGRTPNPCVLCNRYIKIGLLYDYAIREGFDALATGHYARIEKRDGAYRIKKASDRKKDQSYVLYRLRGEALSHLLFPLGEMTKAEARALVSEADLPAQEAPESQDICFVRDGDYASLVERVTGVPAKAGDYIDKSGAVLGRHRGIIHYTVGQHKGLGIALGRVRYVTAIDGVSRTVTLGDEEDLYQSEVTLAHVHYIGERRTSPYRASVKLRYGQREEEATVYPEGEGARLVFARPQRAPAPGQSAVLYEGEYLLGGGII